MRRFVLITVVSLAIAFGAGVAVGAALTSSVTASVPAGAASISPEAIQRGIDARTLPETTVRDVN